MASGVYKITNKINGHCYIGSAVNIKKRWENHKSGLNKNKRHSRHLQSAWNKYGADAFEFSIIELCFPLALIFREQHYIDTLKPEYNISPTAGSRLGSKSSDETRAKVSAATKAQMTTPEARAFMSKIHKGKIITPEQRAKMSEALRGRVVSPETRAKMSERMKGNKNMNGYKPSPETNAKTSERMKGNKIWVGRKHTDEQLIKMSEAHKGKSLSPEARAKISEANKTRIITPEIRAKMSASAILFWSKKKSEKGE